ALVENIYRRIAAAVGADAPGAALQGQRRRRDGCAAPGQSQRRRVRRLSPDIAREGGLRNRSPRLQAPGG
ncbi:MAG: hypothetical protein NZM94_09720, partial [Roseiflexus sp.]|nr:hypothetical protein [Roseiflexus sp.]